MQKLTFSCKRVKKVYKAQNNEYHELQKLEQGCKLNISRADLYILQSNEVQ